MSRGTRFHGLAEQYRTVGDPAALVALAREIATAAHDGWPFAPSDPRQPPQTDWNGDPYIAHPAEVAAAVAELGGTPEQQAAAWLHDVLEDCPAWSAASLRDLGVPDTVVEIVVLVTKLEGDKHETAIERICMFGPRAALPKLADTLVNRRRCLATLADPHASVPQQRKARGLLLGRYEPAVKRLAEVLGLNADHLRARYGS